MLYSKNLHASIWGFGLPLGLAELPGATHGRGFCPQRGSRRLAGAAWRDVLLRRVCVVLTWDPAAASSLPSAPNWAKKSLRWGQHPLCPRPGEASAMHAFVPDVTSTTRLSQALCQGSAETLSPLSLASLFKRKKDDFSSRRPRSFGSERQAGAVPAHASSPAIKLLQLKCR